MQQVISSQNLRTIDIIRSTRRTRVSLLSKFITWLNAQEQYRLFWLGIALMGGIGTVLPLTLIAVVFGTHNDFTLWIIACAINVPVLILNLAAQPPKITVPVLLFAWLVDAAIIVYSAITYFAG
jgi:hypothetical protein